VLDLARIRPVERDPEVRELIEKRKKYSKMGANMERCVVDVMAQGKSRDAAFAICTASLQKAGQFEPGSNKLTAKGKKASGRAKRKDGMDQKHSDYEAMVKSEGKGAGNMRHLLEQLENLILIHEQIRNWEARAQRAKDRLPGPKRRAKKKQDHEVKMGRACGPGEKMVFGRCQKVKRLRGR
jgi:hypothetical protein